MTESGVKRASILLLASVSLLLVFVTGERYLRPVRAEVSPGITHEIPSTELPAVIAQANKGDLNATKRLAGYYLIARNDEISALPWMKKKLPHWEIRARSIMCWTRSIKAPIQINTKRHCRFPGSGA